MRRGRAHAREREHGPAAAGLPAHLPAHPQGVGDRGVPGRLRRRRPTARSGLMGEQDVFVPFRPLLDDPRARMMVCELISHGENHVGPKPVAALVLGAAFLAAACGSSPSPAPTAIPGASSLPAAATAAPSWTATPAPSDAGAPLLAVTALPGE